MARDRERELRPSAVPAALRGLAQVGFDPVALQEGLHAADLVCRALEEGHSGVTHSLILPQIRGAGQWEGSPTFEAPKILVKSGFRSSPERPRATRISAL